MRPQPAFETIHSFGHSLGSLYHWSRFDKFVKTALIDIDKLATGIAANSHNSMTQEMMI